MATNTIILTELFTQKWGVKPQGGDIKITDNDGSKNVAVTNAGNLKDRVSSSNIINTPNSEKGSSRFYAKDTKGRYVFLPLTLGDVFLPYSWMSVRGVKRIVETPLTERRGMVREDIAIEDYEFSVRGFLIGHDGRFPANDIEKLRKLFERREALTAKNGLMDIFTLNPQQGGQDKVIMFNLELDESQGIEHVRAYSFILRTDQEFELEITD